MRELHFLNNALDERIQVAPFLIVGGADVVDAVVKEQVGDGVLFALLIERDGYAPLLFHEGHAGDVGNPVPEIDHILVVNDAFGHFFVDLAVVRFVVNALGNTEDILRLLGVIDGDFR